MYMVCAGIYKYYLDEDAVSVSFRPLYQTPNDVYPSVSICITSPFEDENFKAAGLNVTSKEYADFLRGDLQNDDLFNIDYKKVSFKLIDYVLGYEITYRDTTILKKNYSSYFNGNGEDKDLIFPRYRIIMANLLCFGIDVSMKREIIGIGIMIKTNIFH